MSSLRRVAIKSTSKPILLILFAIFVLIGVIWYHYFVIGSSSFNKETATIIHDSIIQGISGLGAVAIAVFIFMIQSLENRNESLEQTTLNYISQTLGWSYPEWTNSLEDDIRNKTLTHRYYANPPLKIEKLIAAERDRQQKRLEEALDLHTRIEQTIVRIRNDVFYAAIFLILPILSSLLLLMEVDFVRRFLELLFYLNRGPNVLFGNFIIDKNSLGIHSKRNFNSNVAIKNSLGCLKCQVRIFDFEGKTTSVVARWISFKDGKVQNNVEEVFMVKGKKVSKKKFFQCDVCGHGYLDKETASKCEVWCKEKGTCSVEITKKAIYFPNLPTHLVEMGEK